MEEVVVGSSNGLWNGWSGVLPACDMSYDTIYEGDGTVRSWREDQTIA